MSSCKPKAMLVSSGQDINLNMKMRSPTRIFAFKSNSFSNEIFQVRSKLTCCEEDFFRWFDHLEESFFSFIGGGSAQKRFARQ